MEDKPNPIPTVSIILLGESQVGKTALIRRFDNDMFTSEFYTSLGIDFVMKELTLSGEQVQAQVWDTAGQQCFMTITKSFYRRADGILLVYSTANRGSYDKLSVWASSIKGNIQECVPKILVANKADLVEDRMVTSEEGAGVAKKHGMTYRETSAKTGLGVREVFDDVIGRAWEVKRHKEKSQSLVLSEKEASAAKKKLLCC